MIVITKKIEDSMEICVKDNGEGIPEQVRDKIFQPFFTTKPTGSGTGLGLSISKNLSELMGGSMWVESELGKGSVFHFTCKFQKTAFNFDSTEKARLDVLEGKKAAVIEHNDFRRASLVNQSENLGMKTVGFKSIVEFESNISEGSDLSVIFVEQGLDSMQPDELVDRVRKICGDAKVVHADDRHERTKRHGQRDYKCRTKAPQKGNQHE